MSSLDFKESVDSAQKKKVTKRHPFTTSSLIRRHAPSMRAELMEFLLDGGGKASLPPALEEFEAFESLLTQQQAHNSNSGGCEKVQIVVPASTPRTPRHSTETNTAQEVNAVEGGEDEGRPARRKPLKEQANPVEVFMQEFEVRAGLSVTLSLLRLLFSSPSPRIRKKRKRLLSVPQKSNNLSEKNASAFPQPPLKPFSPSSSRSRLSQNTTVTRVTGDARRERRGL